MRRTPTLLVMAAALAASSAVVARPGVAPALAPGAASRLLAGESEGIRLGGSTFALTARPRTILAPRAPRSLRDGSSERTAPRVRPTTYRGTLAGAPWMNVALAVRDGVGGIVVGPSGDGWVLSPRADGGADAVPFSSLAHPLFGEGDGIPTGPPAPPAGPVGDEPRRFRLALDVDNAYLVRNPDDWQEDVLELVDLVGTIYEAQLGVRWEVVSLTAWETLDPYRSIYACQGSGPAGQTGKLEQLRSYWQQYRGGVARDAVHLITGETLAGQFIGCAYIRALNNSYAYGVSRFRQEAADAWFYNHVTLVAHEIGHNFSGLHERSISAYTLRGSSTVGGTLMNPIAEANVLRFSELSAVTSPVTGQPLDNRTPMRAYAEDRLALLPQ